VRDFPLGSAESGQLVFTGQYLGGSVWQVGAVCSVKGAAVGSAAHSVPRAAARPRLDPVGMTLPLILTSILSEANFFFASFIIISGSLRNHFLFGFHPYCKFL